MQKTADIIYIRSSPRREIFLLSLASLDSSQLSLCKFINRNNKPPRCVALFASYSLSLSLSLNLSIFDFISFPNYTSISSSYLSISSLSICFHRRFIRLMATTDTLETAATTTSLTDLDENRFVRRRPTAASASAAGCEESDATLRLNNCRGSDDSLSFEDDKDRNGAVFENLKENDNSVAEKAAVDLEVSALKFAYRPSVPAHRRVKESPLSSDAIFKQSHAGLFNLCIVVLVAVNSRLIIENLMKYGWLIRTGFWFSSRSLRDWPLLMCCLSLPVFPLSAFLVEKLAQRKFISEPVIIFLHVIITTAAVLYPVLMILRFDSAVLSGVTLMLFACIVWLKLVSYAHTSHDMRVVFKSIDEGDISPNSLNLDYPRNISIKSLVYFMLAPTLCYQPSYPRTAHIRKGWVVRQFLKLIIFTGVMGFIIEQYINPIVKNSQHPLKGSLLNATERILKLSVPNLYVWLCMFYCFFHLWLNVLAELLRFGDREFYKDWWNAKTVEEYWRMWNMPVHKWMVRHIYFPCLRRGIPKGFAIVISFLVSAVFHELCIAVPCHMFKLWAFIGIMFQVPLVLITNYLQNMSRNSMVGNMIFWFIFCILGQPMCLLLYYHDLMNRKGID